MEGLAPRKPPPSEAERRNAFDWCSGRLDEARLAEIDALVSSTPPAARVRLSREMSSRFALRVGDVARLLGLSPTETSRLVPAKDRERPWAEFDHRKLCVYAFRNEMRRVVGSAEWARAGLPVHVAQGFARRYFRPDVAALWYALGFGAAQAAALEEAGRSPQAIADERQAVRRAAQRAPRPTCWSCLRTDAMVSGGGGGLTCRYCGQRR